MTMTKQGTSRSKARAQAMRRALFVALAVALAAADSTALAVVGELPADGAARMRREVATLVAGAKTPTPEEMVRATVLAAAARSLAPREPWGYAAECDIALRWGNGALVDKCAEELVRVAPNHAETARALAAVRAFQRGRVWPAVIGWSLLALFVVVSFAGAPERLAGGRLSARARGAAAATSPIAAAPSRPTSVAVALAVAAALVAFGGGGTRVAAAAAPVPSTTASAERLSNFAIDDADPESSVPSAAARDGNPMQYGYFLQDLGARADERERAGDHASAARYYRALAKAVPDVAVGWAHLCSSLEAAGQREAAIDACKRALGLPGVVVADSARFVRLVLAKRGQLTAEETADVKAVVEHLESEAESRVTAAQLRCTWALRAHDVPMLEACTKTLDALAPNEAETISFAWALALENHDRAAADRLITRAKAAGVKPEGLSEMEKATAELGGFWTGTLAGWRGLVAVGLALAAAAAALMWVRRASRQSAA